MLTKFIRAAMQDAMYECLPGHRSYYGEIPGFPGVWANADTLEQCRSELQEVMEDWLTLGIRMGHDIPSVEGLSLATLRDTSCPC